jgi:hypothetical protein
MIDKPVQPQPSRASAQRQPLRDEYDYWPSLRRIQGVMIVNENELLSLIDALQNDQRLVISITQSDRISLFNELVRLAHNYLSAVSMLVDHTRIFMDRFSDNPVSREYHARIKVLLKETPAPVLKKLRNYLLHYRIPPFGVNMKLETPLRMTVYLDRDQALEYKDWGLSAREYLQRQPKQVVFRDLITVYSTELGSLYEWLQQQLMQLYNFRK